MRDRSAAVSRRLASPRPASAPAGLAPVRIVPPGTTPPTRRRTRRTASVRVSGRRRSASSRRSRPRRGAVIGRILVESPEPPSPSRAATPRVDAPSHLCPRRLSSTAPGPVYPASPDDPSGGRPRTTIDDRRCAVRLAAPARRCEGGRRRRHVEQGDAWTRPPSRPAWSSPTSPATPGISRASSSTTRRTSSPTSSRRSSAACGRCSGWPSSKATPRSPTSSRRPSRARRSRRRSRAPTSRSGAGCATSPRPRSASATPASGSRTWTSRWWSTTAWSFASGSPGARSCSGPT